MGNYHSGLWVIDIESPDGRRTSEREQSRHTWNRQLVTTSHMEPMVPLSTVRTTTSDGRHSSGRLSITRSYTYLSCITTGLYIVQLDIDEPYGNPASL